MNFKPNVKKVILSIIVGLIIGGLFVCKCIISNFSDWVKYTLPVYLGFIIGTILTYILWSLFEKKEVVDKNKKGVKNKK